MNGRIYTQNPSLVHGQTIVYAFEMPTSYYMNRIEKTRQYMKKNRIDLLILTGITTDKGNYSYFSKTLPVMKTWPDSYLLVPLRGEPVVFHTGNEREYFFFKTTTWVRDPRSATKGVRDVIDWLKALSPKPKKIGTVGIGPSRHQEIFKQIQSEMKGVSFVALDEFVTNLRRIKDEREISMLLKAGNSLDLVYKTLAGTICREVAEYEAQSKAERMVKIDGARDVRFLWATGPEGSSALTMFSERPFAEGDQITVHCAAEFGGYWAEMGRVFSLGKPSEKYAKMYAGALEAFNKGVNALKPNNKASSVYKEIRKALKEHGLQDNVQEDYGFGHAIGLDNPEPPFFDASSNDTIKKGMVFSLRVPLYKEGTGSLLIEDTIAVEKTGPVSLTTSPRELKILQP